jgi:uncharacterized protein (DUF169 family)
MTFEEIHAQGEVLRNLIMLHSYPLAVKFYRPGEEFPEKTRRPSDFEGRKWAICQAWAAARHIGWTVGINAKESVCPPSNILFGWAEEGADQHLVEAWLEMGIAKDVHGVERFLAEHCRFGCQEVSGIVFAPLSRAKVFPDLVMIHCNPAQAGILVGAYLHKEGKSINSNFRSSAACASALIGTLKKNEPQVCLPCSGERGLARSQDSELIFIFPGKMLGDIIQGLESMRKTGYSRFPIVPYLLYEPDLIPPYRKLQKKVRIVN